MFNKAKKARTEMDNLFDDAEREFKKRSNESINRAKLNNKDAFKMVNPFLLGFGFLTLGGLKKGVDAFVS